MKRSTYLSSLIIAPLLAGPAFGQDDLSTVDAEEEEIRRYTVEMIIFTYTENVSSGSEVFIPDPPPELPEEALLEELSLTYSDSDPVPVFADPAAGEVLAEVEEPEEELLEVELNVRRMYDLWMLPETLFTMGEIYDHLERLDVYEPVLHFGWTQQSVAEDDAQTRHLSSLVTPPDDLGLEGDFKLYLGRYLHLVVNLQLDEPTAEPVINVPLYDDYGDASFDRAAEPPVHYRIQEDRIFKSGEVRYFDHPKFGVLAKISRWEAPDTEEILPEEFLGEPELIGFDGEQLF